MKKIVVFTLCVFWSMSMMLARGEEPGEKELQEAHRLFEAERYEEAAQCYRKAAEANNYEAQANLAVCFFGGIGVEASEEQGEYWLLKSAKGGNAIGQFLLGKYYLNKSLTREKAVKWFRMSAEQDYAPAQTAIGWIYHQTAFSVEIRHDGPEAVKWFKKAAAQNDAEAQYMLGLIYLNGYDDEDKDPDEALKWLEKAAEQNHPQAQKELAEIYAKGVAGKVDEKKAFENHLRAAKAGHPLEQYEVGRCYELGLGVEKDFREAVRWYRMAESNHVPATFGHNYSSAAARRMRELRSNASSACNKGRKALDNKKYEEAVKAFEEAAAIEYAEGQYWLGRCYYFGWGVEKDIKKTKELYEGAAVQGYTDAQFGLGALYYDGHIDGERDFERAVEWWLKAKNSSLLAQYWLGVCYSYGRGVEKDMQEAIKYWNLSARGNADAKTKLGMCYYEGNGVEQDYKTAFYYFNVANFSAEGWYMSGVCYENGQGTTKNIKMAINCYNQAAKEGHEKAKEALERLK